MNYISTRGNYEKVSGAEAIRLGMVPNGGLFVPETIPQIDLKKIPEMDYKELSNTIMRLFLTDYSNEEISNAVSSAYNGNNFNTPDIVPLKLLDEKTAVLELWHGPTAAFKDLALQILPYLLTTAVKKLKSDKEIVILVATSGDTGKAALEGFKDVPGTKIIVFYPHGGVSKIQELQMNTTDGDNTHVVAVRGNFDDCQNMVKEIFGDESYASKLNEDGYEFSSANSINWGRLLPQIIYYFWSYITLIREKRISGNEKINFVVPTGNFGNILAGYYAYKMGLPVNRFICASNKNKVLTDFFRTGIYKRDREFFKTSSPSMDILISSNLERFLFEVTGHNHSLINSYYDGLMTKGEFNSGDDVLKSISDILTGGWAAEDEVLSEIKMIFNKYDYLIDTHTAVAVNVFNKYRESTDDRTFTVIDSTASAFKFNKAVYGAVSGDVSENDEILLLEKLSEKSGVPVHRGLLNLTDKSINHSAVIDVTEAKDQINRILGL